MATEDDMARLKQLEEKMDGLGIQFEKVREDIKKLGEGYEDVSLIRFRGHLPKGGYDGTHGITQGRPASAAAVQ